MNSAAGAHQSREVLVPVDGRSLPGTLTVPSPCSGLVVFAHGSGSSRHSPRNRQVAAALHARGIGTLLFDLLSEAEAERVARDASGYVTPSRNAVSKARVSKKPPRAERGAAAVG